MFTKFTYPHREKLPKWQILLELAIHEGLDHKLLIQLNLNRLIGLKYLMSKGEETKAKILHQAAELFNQQGYAGSSISDIMRVTGLQKGGIYNHFSSKDELALKNLK
jgi:AcrR family transcriptional regulator